MDYGARFYDLVIGRWHSVDPHGENYLSWTFYHYAANNPLLITDPDGKDWYRNDETGATFWQKGNDNFSTYNDQKYRNIGETYSQYADGVRIDYNQNEVAKVSDVDPDYNLKGGEYIPKTVTTDDGTKVNVTFNYSSPNGGNGDKALSRDAVSLLITGLNEANNSGANIKTIDVSTTTTGEHTSPKSLHYVANGARAFDIDVVNGVSVRDPKSRSRDAAIHNGMKESPYLYENYTPFIQEKGGLRVSVPERVIHGSTKKRR